MISQPENKIDSLEGLVKELNAKKNALEETVTVLSTEVVNLRKAIAAETYTIGEIEKRKEELQGQISEVSASLALKQKEHSLLFENIKEATDELSQIRSEVVQVKGEFESEQERLDILKQSLSEKEKYLDKTIDDYNKRALFVDESQKALEAKAKALQNAINVCLQ